MAVSDSVRKRIMAVALGDMHVGDERILFRVMLAVDDV